MNPNKYFPQDFAVLQIYREDQTIIFSLNITLQFNVLYAHITLNAKIVYKTH